MAANPASAPNVEHILRGYLNVIVLLAAILGERLNGKCNGSLKLVDFHSVIPSGEVCAVANRAGSLDLENVQRLQHWESTGGLHKGGVELAIDHYRFGCESLCLPSINTAVDGIHTRIVPPLFNVSLAFGVKLFVLGKNAKVDSRADCVPCKLADDASQRGNICFGCA